VTNDGLSGLAVSYQTVAVLASYPSNARVHSPHQIRVLAP